MHCKGYPVSAWTREPLEHLNGCEQFVARCNEERDQQAHKNEQERKKQKLDAQQSVATDGAENLSQAALITATLITPNSSSGGTSTAWLAFTDTPPVQPGFAQCTLQRRDGKPCNTIINHCCRTTKLRHFLSVNFFFRILQLTFDGSLLARRHQPVLKSPVSRQILHLPETATSISPSTKQQNSRPVDRCAADAVSVVFDAMVVLAGELRSTSCYKLII